MISPPSAMHALQILADRLRKRKLSGDDHDEEKAMLEIVGRDLVELQTRRAAAEREKVEAATKAPLPENPAIPKAPVLPDQKAAPSPKAS